MLLLLCLGVHEEARECDQRAKKFGSAIFVFFWFLCCGEANTREREKNKTLAQAPNPELWMFVDDMRKDLRSTVVVGRLCR